MKAVSKIFGITVSCLCLALVANAAFEKSGDAIKSAQQKLQKKDYAGAREDAGQAIELAKTPAEKIAAMFFLGQIAENSGDVPKAISEYEKIVTDAQATNAQKIDALNKIANTWLIAKDKNFDKARECYAKALALPELQPKERLGVQMSIARSFERQQKPAEARAEFEKLLADKDADSKLKIDVYNGLANLAMSEPNFDKARECYAKALALPELKQEDKSAVQMSVAKSFERQNKWAEAQASLEKFLENKELDIRSKINAYNALAGTQIQQAAFDKARASYAAILAFQELSTQDRANTHLSIGKSFERQSNWSAAKAEYAKCLSIEKVPDAAKFSALCAIAGALNQEKNLPEMKKAVDAVLEAKGSANGKAEALRNYAQLASEKNEKEEALAAWKQLSELPEVASKDCSAAVLSAMEILSEKGGLADAQALADKASANPQMPIGDRFLAKLIVLGMGASGKEGAVKAEANKAADCLDKNQLTPELKSKAFMDAAKFFMKSSKYGIVREFIALEKSLYRQDEQRVYQCRFMEKAPVGVEGWMLSDIVKDPKNRESRFDAYDRKAAELLINDVRSERATGDAKAASDKDTGFYMAADSKGWHIFVRCEDSEAEKVAAGLTGGGQLEMYFAKAYGERYYQWLFDLQSGKFDPVDWDSPHRNFRLMEDYCKSESSVLDKAIGAYFFFPWEMIYDSLPKNGEKWPFGIIRWTRAGGITNGGQVHDIHKWGVVNWDGFTPERVTAIKRKLVMKGLGNYQKVKGDIANFWKDSELGDPDFYKEVLQPAMEKLDALGKKVVPEMTPADIDSLFETAVPDWMEFKYKVAELRADYLKKKMFAAEKP